jgi:hypothetical protein
MFILNPYRFGGAAGTDFTTNLVASWQFENDFLDYTANNHDATKTGTVNFATGKVGNAADFIGVFDLLTVADSDDFSFTDGITDLPFSISFWVNIDVLGAFIVLLNKRDGSISNREWDIFVSTTGTIGMQLFSPTNSPDNRLNITQAGLVINTWYHLVFTYDGTEAKEGLKLYLDGVSTGTQAEVGTYAGMTNTISSLTLGSAFHDNTLELDGKMDEVKIWKGRELSQAEVTELYDLEKAGTSVLPAPASGIYDNASVVYSLRRPDMATKWTNAVLQLRRSGDNAFKTVFFDGDAVGDTITLNSKIGDTLTTPSATTLGDWIGSNDAYVVQWVGITPNNIIDIDKRAIQATTTLQPQFISSGTILTKNGKPVIDFLNTNTFLLASANTDLNSGNSYTSLTVSGNNSSVSVGTIYSTSASPTNRITIFNDRTANKFASFIVASTGNFEAKTLLQQNNSNQKLLTSIIEPTNLKTYLNNTIQTSTARTGTYLNNDFILGRQSAEGNYLNGTIQEITIFPSDKTADLTELHADINTYYGIY